MATMNYLKVYPSNIESLSIVCNTSEGQTLTISDFTKDSVNDRLIIDGISGVNSIYSASAVGYPTPRILTEMRVDGYEHIIDFRPVHLYSVGDETISASEYIYVDNLETPTGVFNSQGWASLNAFDWSWGSYSNFYSVSYNSSTDKYDIDCTQYVGTGEPGGEDIVPDSEIPGR